jgi:hypothetical protein
MGMKTLNSRPLKLALLGNGIFSATSGALLLIVPEQIGGLLGVQETWLLMLIGLGLAVFAGDLFHQATRDRLRTWRALYSVCGDLLWVIGTIILLLFFPAAVSAQGATLLIGVAMVVTLFAGLQLWGAGQAHRIRGTSRYRHCVAVSVPASAGRVWGIVSDLGNINRHAPFLRDSFLRDNARPGEGAVRQCEDLNGRRWAEKCTQFEVGKSITMEFLTQEADFPYPASEMVGGWHFIERSATESEVLVWWELRPQPAVLAPVLMPLLALKADWDFPKLIQNMVETDPQHVENRQTKKRYGLIPRVC